MSHGRLDVFNATDGSLLFAQEMAPSVFFGFDDDGFLMEYEGGDKPPRLVFWRMTLNL